MRISDWSSDVCSSDLITIGPAPISRIDSMSSRFGIDGAFLVGFGVAGGRIAPLLDAEHRCELLEQVRAVVGAGAGFGVVLAAARVPAAHPPALANPVLQFDVGGRGAAAARSRCDGEVNRKHAQ